MKKFRAAPVKTDSCRVCGMGTPAHRDEAGRKITHRRWMLDRYAQFQRDGWTWNR
jgi:hypothetical protein